ncbi:Carbonic anhydrase 12 [Manis javanica]|nr:Carbonic anhydrase 12 [Manis javanica]
MPSACAGHRAAAPRSVDARVPPGPADVSGPGLRTVPVCTTDPLSVSRPMAAMLSSPAVVPKLFVSVGAREPASEASPPVRRHCVQARVCVAAVTCAAVRGSSEELPEAGCPLGPTRWKEAAPACGGPAQNPMSTDLHLVHRDPTLGPFTLQGHTCAPPGLWTLGNDGHTGPAREQTGLKGTFTHTLMAQRSRVILAQYHRHSPRPRSGRSSGTRHPSARRMSELTDPGRRVVKCRLQLMSPKARR